MHVYTLAVARHEDIRQKTKKRLLDAAEKMATKCIMPQRKSNLYNLMKEMQSQLECHLRTGVHVTCQESQE